MEPDELRAEVAELRAARSRLVAAADGERRRIERDIHDGAQQHIVALIVNLQLARQLLDSDPEAARNLLDEIAQDAHHALDDVRELALGIYPPLLVDRGLAEAVAGAASGAGIPVTVDAAGLDRRLPPDLEATVYFCVLEALQNAVRHAGAGARATIRLWQEPGTLAFEVLDDGVGFDPRETERGPGLSSILDRLGANGGLLVIDSAPGRGTRVSATIPLDS